MKRESRFHVMEPSLGISLVHATEVSHAQAIVRKSRIKQDVDFNRSRRAHIC